MFFFFKQFYYMLIKTFKNKRLLIFIIAFILFLMFKNSVFASSYNEHNIQNLPDNLLNDLKIRASQYWDNPDYFCYGTYYGWTDGYVINFIKKSSLSNSSIFKGRFWGNTRLYFNQNFNYMMYDYKGDGTFKNKQSSFLSYSSSDYLTFGYHNNILEWYSNFDMYSDENYNNLIFAGSVVAPSIITNSDLICNWTFENLTINGGTSVGLCDNYFLRYTYPDNNTSYQFNINQYFDLSNGTVFFNIPRSRINEDIVIRPNSRIYFTLICQRNLEGGVTTEVYDLNGYDITLSQESADIINQDSDKQLMSDIKQEQQQTTQAVDNLNNSITNTTIEDNSINFPTLEFPDLTRDGLNHIFDAFVLAFCSDEPQDIILPIPNTNKTIVISPYYLYDNLVNNGCQRLVDLIQIFWWYFIARIIIFDIYDKIFKIQSGDVEDIQTENIQAKML